MQRPHLNSLRSLALALGWLVAGPLLANLPGWPEPPANDHFSAALAVTGQTPALEADLAGATTEAFEVIPADQYGHTVWWKWTAPADGTYEWDTAGSAGPVAVTVWTQDGLGQLVPRAGSLRRILFEFASGGAVLADARGTFPVRAGETCWLSADAAFRRPFGFLQQWPQDPFGPGASYLAKLSLRPSTVPAPANDRFADRQPLTGDPVAGVTFRTQLETATADDGEPRLPGESLGRTAWWTWQAPGNGTARLRRVGVNAPPVLGVYQVGPHFALQRLASSGTEFGHECYREWRGRDVLEWDVAAGGRYEIQADRYPWNQPADEFQLELTFTPAPANDDLANAQRLEGNDLNLTVDNFGATRGGDDPILPGRTGSGSVWFHWQAPARGILQVTTNEPVRFAEPAFEILPPGNLGASFSIDIWLPNPCGGAFTDLHPLLPFVAVFGIHQVQGTNDGRLSLTMGGYGTNAAVAEIQGEVLLQLDSLGETSGTTPMRLLFTAGPANERFDSRIILPAAPVRVGGRTFAANVIFGHPVSGRTAWWEWTAPEAGAWVLRPLTLPARHRLWLQRGQTPPQPTANSTTGQPLVFTAAAGEVFQLTAVATEGFGDNVGFELVPAVIPTITLERRREVRNEAWTTLDTLNWPNGYDLPRVFESSPDLEHWTPVPSLDDWRFSTQVNEGEPQRFYRMRLLTD